MFFVLYFLITLFTFVIFPMAFWPLIYFGKKVRSATTTQQMNNGGLYATLNQTFRSMKVIKSYCVEVAETKKLIETLKQCKMLNIKL